MDYNQNKTSKKSPSFILSVLSVFTTVFSLIAYFLPFLSVNFFGKITKTGFDLFMDVLDDFDMPEAGIALAFICSVICVVLSIVSVKARKASIGTIFFSAACMVLAYIGISEDFDYASMGFYMFEIFSFASIIISTLSLITKDE